MATGDNGVSWDLTDYFPSIGSGEYRAFRDGLEERIGVLSQAASRLGPLSDATAAPWANLLLEAEEVLRDLIHLSSYVSCSTAEDAKSEAPRAEEARFARTGAAWEKSQVPFKAMLRGASDDAFAKLVARDGIADARYAVERLRFDATRTMAPDLENLAADLGVDGLDAWDRLWSAIAGNLEFDLQRPDGTTDRVPFAQKTTLLSDNDPAVRRAALEGSNAAWEAVQDTAAACLNGIAGSRLTLNRYRGIGDILDVAMFQAGVSRETVDAMWHAVTELRDIPQSYLKAKAKALGMERLGFQDLTAPLPVESGARMPWSEGVERLLAAFSASYPALADFSREMIDRRRIESEKRGGKRPGGFCTSSHLAEQSRIFMTWGGTYGDLSTLAHELGHAWHSRTMAGMRTLRRNYPMTLAETASTFAEDILARAVLADPATDESARRRLADEMLQDASVYLLNIHMRYVFERAFYAERASGEVSVGRLKELMLDAQRQCYGDALDPARTDPMFWATKLHFYIAGVAFYNFPYTFGYLLSRGISCIFRAEGAAFLPRYEEFLRQTASAPAEDVAASTLGIDLRTPEFWRDAILPLQDDLADYRRTLAAPGSKLPT